MFSAALTGRADGLDQMNRVVKGLLIAGVSLGVLGVAAAGGAWVYFSKELPDHTTLANYNPSVATRVHAGDGRLVAEFASERRVFVPIASIP